MCFGDVVRKYKADLRLNAAVTYAGDSKHGRVTWYDYWALIDLINCNSRLGKSVYLFEKWA